MVVAVAALAVSVFALARGDSGQSYPAFDSAPTRPELGAYPQAFVDEAISRYKELGGEATVEYYNSLQSVAGEWYMFIADENNVMIAHAAGTRCRWPNRRP